MDKDLQKQDMEARSKMEGVSPAVIKRLPRYFRYLRELIREGTMRVSSGELALYRAVLAALLIGKGKGHNAATSCSSSSLRSGKRNRRIHARQHRHA